MRFASIAGIVSFETGTFVLCERYCEGRARLGAPSSFVFAEGACQSPNGHEREGRPFFGDDRSQGVSVDVNKEST
jgi:hypothetical protein